MGLAQARPNYTENVTDLYVHVQTVDTRRSSPIFQVPGYEASIPCEVKQGQLVLGSLTPHVGHTACSQPVVNTATICRHGTHPGLPGGVPQIPYSLREGGSTVLLLVRLSTNCGPVMSHFYCTSEISPVIPNALAWNLIYQ